MAYWLVIAHFTLHYFCYNSTNLLFLAAKSFFAGYFLFFPKCFCSPVLCCLTTDYNILSDGHVDGDGGNLVASSSNKHN